MKTLFKAVMVMTLIFMLSSCAADGYYGVSTPAYGYYGPRYYGYGYGPRYTQRVYVYGGHHGGYYHHGGGHHNGFHR